MKNLIYILKFFRTTFLIKETKKENGTINLLIVRFLSIFILSLFTEIDAQNNINTAIQNSTLQTTEIKSTGNSINFSINNNTRMSLSPSGVLKVDYLSGDGNRFLQTDSEGNVFPWNGNPDLSNHLLFGDGNFKPMLMRVEGDKMFLPQHSKFGIGINDPLVELDILGNARTSNNFTVGNILQLGGSNEFASINYIPSTNTTPAVFNFRVGGGFNNGDPGTGLDLGLDPLPNLSCLNGQINTVNLFSNMLTVKAPNNTSSNGNINIGHNGARAFIETQGSNIATSINPQGNLFINAQCNRNVYLFADNGNIFAPSLNKIMSINGRLNVSDIMQIGHPTIVNFVESASKLYVYAMAIRDGVKVRHGGANYGAGFRAIELTDNDKGIAVYRGTQVSDGSEMFSVQGDGLLTISPSNPKALSILKNGNETFSINKEGYTEISVFSNNNMSNNRVMTVKDINAGRDLFAIRNDGKVYAREVEINLLQTFPDYVFNADYKLPSLSFVEKYIKENKHLPGFNSGKYYEKNGINVNEMLVKQQEKIEELTLYLIQLEKKIMQMKSN